MGCAGREGLGEVELHPRAVRIRKGLERLRTSPMGCVELGWEQEGCGFIPWDVQIGRGLGGFCERDPWIVPGRGFGGAVDTIHGICG